MSMGQPRPVRCVAVMQPYFFPYAGYFRLFAAVDEFVIFDCVQFPRRGRVHRSEVPGRGGATEWLTLPLARQPRDVLIRDLSFAADARERFDQRLVMLPWLGAANGAQAGRVSAFLAAPFGSVIDYLEEGLRLVADILELGVTITRSSGLGLDPSLSGQGRVIAAAQALGAARYVNLSGGQALYDPAVFAAAGIELAFLAPYEGRFSYLLPALMTEPAEVIRRDILETSCLIVS